MAVTPNIATAVDFIGIKWLAMATELTSYRAVWRGFRKPLKFLDTLLRPET